jgi:hypothetical protein
MTGLQAELEAAIRKLPMDLGPDRQMPEGIVENTVAVEVHFTAVGGFDKSIPLEQSRREGLRQGRGRQNSSRHPRALHRCP